MVVKKMWLVLVGCGNFVIFLHCFQIFAMATSTTSIECSVPGCSFRTPRLPERFYPNMVDQLKVQFVFFVVDNIVGIVCIVDIVDFVGIGSPWLPKLVYPNMINQL